MTRELTEEDRLNEREGFFLREFERYKSHQDASLEYTFKVFKHLPVDSRQRLLEQTDYDFFRTLLRDDLQSLIYQILKGINEAESEAESVKMWSIIHENLKDGLRCAILDGNISDIRYHMQSFPSEKTNKVIQSVLMGKDCALLKTVIKQHRRDIIQYFLEHALTQRKMSALCRELYEVQTRVHRIKPSQALSLNETHQSPCSRIKNKLKAFFGSEIKICPVDEQSVENSLSTKTERGSSL